LLPTKLINNLTQHFVDLKEFIYPPELTELCPWQRC